MRKLLRIQDVAQNYAHERELIEDRSYDETARDLVFGNFGGQNFQVLDRFAHIFFGLKVVVGHTVVLREISYFLRCAFFFCIIRLTCVISYDYGLRNRNVNNGIVVEFSLIFLIIKFCIHCDLTDGRLLSLWAHILYEICMREK